MSRQARRRRRGCTSGEKPAVMGATVAALTAALAAAVTGRARVSDLWAAIAATALADADLTVRHLHARFPRWDGRLVVMGASEGAALAPEVAVRHGEATAAVVLMAGGGWDQATELKALAVKAGESTEPLERQFESMEANPVSTLSWRGEDNTYRRWASYLRYRPLDFLVRVAAPVYVVHGARDDSTPIQSSEAIAEEYRRLGRDSLTFRSWPDLDHRWNAPDGTNHLIDVGGEVIGWLVVQVPRR